MKPEYQQKLDKKFRLEFNYNSNRIEGNTLTYGETELLLIFGDLKGNHSKREVDEMERHDVALELIKEWAKDERPLTEADIKSLNEVILVKPFWKDAITADGQETRRLITPGKYKEYPNSVRLENGEIFEYTSPTDTPIAMGELIDWYRAEEEKNELHPIELAALLHYRFVRIHPFDDGNGRISRLLVNYVLLKNELPMVVVKSADKKNYLQALHLADTGDLEAFIDYMAEQLIWSFDISIKAAKGESIDEAGDLNKRIELLKKQQNIGESRLQESKEAIINCYQNSIYPLLRKISESLKKMSEFFIERHEKLYFLTKIGHNVYNNSLPVSLDLSVTDLSSYTANVDEISYQYSFNKLRKQRDFDLHVYVNIIFHQLVYEIIIDQAQIRVDKLYDEIVVESEAQAIAEKIGIVVLEQIEAKLN